MQKSKIPDKWSFNGNDMSIMANEINYEWQQASTITFFINKQKGPRKLFRGTGNRCWHAMASMWVKTTHWWVTCCIWKDLSHWFKMSFLLKESYPLQVVWYSLSFKDWSIDWLMVLTLIVLYNYHLFLLGFQTTNLFNLNPYILVLKHVILFHVPNFVRKFKTKTHVWFFDIMLYCVLCGWLHISSICQMFLPLICFSWVMFCFLELLVCICRYLHLVGMS